MPTRRFIGLKSLESDTIDNDFWGAFLWKSLISKKDRGITCDLTSDLSLQHNLHVCILQPNLTYIVLLHLLYLVKYNLEKENKKPHLSI